MKSILFVIDTLEGAGAERVLITILKNLDYSKYKVDLLLIFKQGVFLKDVPNEVNIISIFDNYNNKVFKKVYSILFHRQLYKHYVKKLYDIEVAALDASPVFFVSHSFNKNSKKLVWIQVDRINSKPIIHKIQSESLYFNFDKIICVSKEVKKSFMNLYNNIDSNKIEVVYNSIETDYIINKANSQAENFNKLTFVSVGRLTYQKGFDILLKAHIKLIKNGFNHQILILGEGEDRKYLENKIKEYKVESAFKLLGFQENPYSIMKKADGYICSSRYEGFSASIAEAVGLGLPVISTPVSGVKELFNNGEFGLIVEPTVKGLYKGIEKFITNDNLRTYYAQKSVERRDFVDIKQTINQIENIFDDI